MLTIPVFLAVTAAYMVKGMCGFANTLVFGTLAMGLVLSEDRRCQDH